MPAVGRPVGRHGVKLKGPGRTSGPTEIQCTDKGYSILSGFHGPIKAPKAFCTPLKFLSRG